MEWRWLRQSGSRRLIVLFGGWGLGAAPYLHLSGDFDILLAQDYRTLSPDLPEAASAYGEKILVAFSFGVVAYAHWQSARPDPFMRKIAMNGTLSPVDRRKGIAPLVFQRTIDGLSEESFQSFLALCYGTPQPHRPADITACKAELRAVATRGAAPETQFDRIWISSGDRIFTPANQHRAWQAQADLIREIDAPHVPFDRWQCWDGICA